MSESKPVAESELPSALVPLAPSLMMAFWMLLGGAAEIKLLQSLWKLLGWVDGEVSIAVPVGAATGAIVGVVLGRIKNPRLLVLLMTVFAGASAGGVAGDVAWERLVGSAAKSSGGRLAGSPGRLGCSLADIRLPPNEARGQRIASPATGFRHKRV